MRALIQRVSRASVTVEAQIVGQIEAGLVILICAMQGDSDAQARALAADTARGNRPGFSTAAPPAEGKRLYDHFTARMRAEGITCANGIFGADMQLALINDGPVTIWLDT